VYQIPESYYQRTGARESNNNVNARNPRSTASGQYQFLDSTYLTYARRRMPGVDDNTLMGRKNDPTFQRQIMEDFTQENAQSLADRGIPTTGGNLYAAHFLGAGGARKVLTSPDEASVEELVGPQVVAANPHLRGMTVAKFKQWADSKYGDGSTDGAVAQADPSVSGGVNPADLPAPGAQAAIDTGGGGLFRTAAGERGPLFGNEQTVALGDGLIGVGAAMMARDNPQAAQVLLASIKKDKKQGTNNKTFMNQPTGELITVDQNGNLLNKHQVTPKPEKPAPPEKPLAPGAIKILESNWGAAETAGNVAEKMNKYRDMIMSGDLDVSLMNRVGADFRNILNDDTADPKIRNLARFMADMEDMRNARLLEAKGVQTEGDAQRAMNALTPGTTRYNNQTMLELLDRASGDLNKAYKHHSSKYERAAGVFKQYDPDGFTLQELKDRGGRLDTFESGYAPRRDEYFKRGSAGTPTTQQPAAGGSMSPAAQAAAERWKRRQQGQ
jgi:hypothetical protein